jgi:predicted O-methyltransferase YrrM
MSAMFMLGMQPYIGWTIHLTTVEGWEPQFTLAKQRLKERYHEAITCHFGLTQNVLPELMSTLGPIDLMYHDAGHTREDYVRDFGAVVNSLSPGAVIVIDDIRFGGEQTEQTNTKPYPSASGSTKCCSQAGFRDRTNHEHNRFRWPDDRLSALLDRVPTALRR